MLHTLWFRRLFGPQRPAFRRPPRLETLEDRCLLATLVGLTSAGNVVRFDSSTPGTQTTIATNSGVVAGQSLVAIDFNPANGQLYGLGFGGGTGQIYKIDPSTAVCTAVGTPFSTKLNGTLFGFSFDPVSDKIRIVDNAGENLRVDPTTGALVSTDTSITPGSDTITAAAYSNNFPGASQTTLYGYDEANNNIVTIGSVNGSPNSPNTGKVSNVGSSGVKNSNTGADLGFAIDADNTAYLNLVVSGTSGLYTANLGTGATSFVGTFGGVTMVDITVAPAVSLSVNSFPASRTTGLAASFIVTAQTVYGTTATGYAGTVTFSSSDPAAVLAGGTKLVNGTNTVGATLNTVGVQSITATDAVNPSINGSQTNITVLPNTELLGITTNNKLVDFFSATPGNVTTIGTVTGLTSGQTLVALAVRPKTNTLYGLGFGSGAAQLYTLDATTAAATAVGAPFSTTISGVDFGFNFDPVQDIVRVTTNANENFRVNPDTGALIAQDTILTPTTANVVGIAYNDNVAGASTTTLFGYDVSSDNLVIVGTAGSATSANGGVVTNVGASGVTSSAGAAGETGFAIDSTGAAYLNLDVNNTSGLYTVNLATGAVAINGNFASGVALRDLTVVPVNGFGGKPTVNGVDLVGLTSANKLVHFNSATPSKVTIVGTISGVTAGQKIVGIDFRPATDELYGLGIGGGTAQLYKINPTTAAATPLVSTFSVLSTDTSFGFGFDPVTDVARVISNSGENLRVNPTTGALVATDSILNPSSVYGGVAYTNNVSGATSSTLYSYDFTNNKLVTIGSVSGSPNSPNSGKVSTVGSSGVKVSAGTAADVGFDVGGDGVPYLNLVVGGNSGLYTANLSTGLVSFIGNFNSSITLLGLTEAPATMFAVSGYPSPTTTGTAGTFTVTAQDPYGTTIPFYQGTVTFTSSDTAATLPANTTLTNGVGTFTATFNTAGTQSLTASDLAVPTINGTQFGIVVSNGSGGGGGGTSPPPPGTLFDKIGVIRTQPVSRTAVLSLDSNGNGTFDGSDAVFGFGFSTDKFLVGDWANLGYDSVGVVRATASGVAQFSLDTNGDNTFDNGDSVFNFGLNTDTFVTGDWNGSGTTKIGVVRPQADGTAVWSLDTNGNGAFDSGDTVTTYGLAGDTYITGDWTGTGHTEIGIVRPTASGVLEWVLNTSGTGSFNANDTVYFYGLNSDTPVVGDWTGSGTTKIGIVRQQPSGVPIWALDINGNGVFESGSDSVFSFGVNTDRFIIGKWKAPQSLVSGDGALNSQVQPLANGANFQSVVYQAIGAWQQAGLDPADVARLQNVNYQVAALGGATLGVASGNSITIDATAAGHGWSTSATPQPGQMDLFTTLAHEMGHTLGLPDQGAQQGDVMFDSLLPGIRKAPTTQDVDAVFAALGHS